MVFREKRKTIILDDSWKKTKIGLNTFEIRAIEDSAFNWRRTGRIAKFGINQIYLLSGKQANCAVGSAVEKYGARIAALALIRLLGGNWSNWTAKLSECGARCKRGITRCKGRLGYHWSRRVLPTDSDLLSWWLECRSATGRHSSFWLVLGAEWCSGDSSKWPRSDLYLGNFDTPRQVASDGVPIIWITKYKRLWEQNPK